ncbi:MAG: TonB-dependent receptor [Ignavibacteria bacterium]|nr:TonB-dependent receptor [Ignavibacteria bacterium]
MNVRHALLLFSCFLLTKTIAAAQADDATINDTTTYYLSPIIVSPTNARNRETPVTFSNISQHQLADRYSVQDIPVLLSELPSMTFYSENGNGIGYNYINLRGFDQRRLSVMINGVPQNDPEDHNVYWIDFPDLLASTGSIQVQRGAGSAFYGPPAIGGSVNLVTTPFDRKPGITFESMFGFQEFGDSSNSLPLNTRKYNVTINSGLIDHRYMLYSKLGKILSDGYRANSWVELNSYFLGALRIDQDMTTRFHVFGGPLADGLAYVGLPKSFVTDKKLRRTNFSYWDTTGYFVPQKPQTTESFSQPHYELIHEWRLSPSTTLHNTLFYYTGEGYFDYDGDWVWFDQSASPWFHNNIGYDSTFGVSRFPTFVFRAFVGNKQWGWLPRIELEHPLGSLTVGSELRFHRSIHWGKIQSASELPSPGFDPDFHFYEYNGEKDILSLYAHEIFRLQQHLTIMGDLQLVRNRYGIKNEKFLGNDFSISYLFANPRFGLNYNIDDEWNAYASAGYTSREPRLRNLYAAEDSYFGATPQFTADTSNGRVIYNFDAPFAKPEHLLDVELGCGFRTSSSQFSGNVFWMEFTDELVNSGQVDIFGQPVTGNAERTRHIGVELDGNISLPLGITVNGNISLSRNRLIRHIVYVESHDSSGTSTLVPTPLDNNPIAGFPDVLGNFRLTYSTGALTSSLVTKYVGDFHTDNFASDQNKNPDYTVVNAEVLYRSPSVFGVQCTVRGEVRNLFDRLYSMSGDGNAFFPAAERNYLIGITASL